MDSWSPNDIPDQTGKVVVVTGANSGLGYEIALALAARGASVALAVRDEAKGEAAVQRITARHPGASVQVRRLDLADLRSIRDFAESWTDPLDVLVANAGLMAVDESRTVDGFETQFGVNHLGHFALTALLLPRLAEAPAARVGAMSSIGHRGARGHADPLGSGRYDRWQSYFQSKLANLRFAFELDRRLQRSGSTTRAVAAHPGGSATDLGTEGGSISNRLSLAAASRVTQSAARGAEPMLRAVASPEDVGGRFLGPRWRIRGSAVIEKPSAAARDVDAARALWEESIRLTGIDPDI